MLIKANRKYNRSSKLLKIFDVAEFSIHDGPGIRTVVYFQGCSAQCDWCHSPHSQPKCAPLLLNTNICIQCKRCEDSCPTHAHTFTNGTHTINRGLCNQCGICIENCPNSIMGVKGSALHLPTIEVTARSLFEQIEPYMKLHSKGNGITLSGGEALLQLEAAKELLEYCINNGFNTAVETSGLLPLKTYQQVLPLVNTWLFGTRIITGGNNVRYDKHVDKVLCLLTSSKANIIPRIPMVPSFFDREEILQGIANLLKKHAISTICFNQWNKDYDNYYVQSGIPLQMERPSDEKIEECEIKIKSYFTNLNFKLYGNTQI